MQAARNTGKVFSFSRVIDSCGIRLNFLKEYKQRPCVTLWLTHAGDRTILGKHGKFFSTSLFWISLL